MEDDKIVKGFNEGYELARQDLILAKTISESYKGVKSDFVLAYESGIKEVEFEEKSKDLNKYHNLKLKLNKDDIEMGK
ncbi:MAG: hypothetical protein SH818_10290 [Saprospiraceae bacterium]|nr:hypothetical protein [Saprospiraceae bacterium]